MLAYDISFEDSICMSILSPEIIRALDEVYGPVQAEFTLTQIPAGHAPVEIKEAWIGLPLPVREHNLGTLALGTISFHDHLSRTEVTNDEPVPITGIEAVDTLQQSNKLEAARFWMPYAAGLFTFRTHEGELAPIRKS